MCSIKFNLAGAGKLSSTDCCGGAFKVFVFMWLLAQLPCLPFFNDEGDSEAGATELDALWQL